MWASVIKVLGCKCIENSWPQSNNFKLANFSHNKNKYNVFLSYQNWIVYFLGFCSLEFGSSSIFPFLLLFSYLEKLTFVKLVKHVENSRSWCRLSRFTCIEVAVRDSL